MAIEETNIFSARTEKLWRKLESWRKTGQGRIPEQLWCEAVGLARAVGVSRVARVLRLDYYGLRRRVQESLSSTMVQKPPTASFVEVEIPSVRAMAQCVVKLEDRSGKRLTVELPAGSVAEVAGIAGALWSRRS
jgi:hypothetical protein